MEAFHRRGRGGSSTLNPSSFLISASTSLIFSSSWEIRAFISLMEASSLSTSCCSSTVIFWVPQPASRVTAKTTAKSVTGNTIFFPFIGLFSLNVIRWFSTPHRFASQRYVKKLSFQNKSLKKRGTAALTFLTAWAGCLPTARPNFSGSLGCERPCRPILPASSPQP